MFGQKFESSDIFTVGVLVLLEGLLSADNALVLAIMVRHLPAKLQKRALLYGLGGAFFFRFIAILFSTLVMQLWWLQAVGAAYLVFVPLKHFFGRKSEETEVKSVGKSFWGTVIAVEITDIAFAIDSVLAGVALVRGQAGKVWVVFLGAVIGIVLLRYAASLFIRLLERYPTLDHVAYVIVGWVGVKLAFLSAHTYDDKIRGGTMHIPELPPLVFWGVLGLIVLIGGYFAVRYERKNSTELDSQISAVEGLERGEDNLGDEPGSNDES